MKDAKAIRQCLGRCHRTRPLTVEEKVVMKVNSQLLDITNETVLLKNGQIILFGPTTEGIGHSLHLDKAKKTDSI